MKSKKLLVALAMPMLFAACSQEELAIVDNSVKVDLSNRAVVANVGLNLGVDSRLSVQEGGVYAAQWDENDGVGACIIDAPTYQSYPTATEIADKENGIQDFYSLTPYISSNYKYSKGENGVWTTQALMVEGNYMFYAPHSESFVTRMPAIASFPAVQNIDPEAEIRNSSIQDFYQSGNPVVVGYEFLSAADQDATISPKLYNIYAYPKFTLKNSYKDENGVAQDLNISKIVIKGDFVTKAYLNNTGLQTNLAGGEESLWTENRIETAATSDILDDEAIETADEIVVNFGEGLNIAAGAKEEFFIVLPAEDYRGTNRLVVEIYTSENVKFANDFRMNGFVLNPGNAYPAEEYNTVSQTLKGDKGALATIDVKGTLVDYTQKNTGIKNNEELINYITNVAKRFDDIREVNDAFVLYNTFAEDEYEGLKYGEYYAQYNPKLHFTLHKNAEIVINDELIDVLIDQLGDKAINNQQDAPSITFLGKSMEEGKIKLGNLTKYSAFDIFYNGKVGDNVLTHNVDKDTKVEYMIYRSDLAAPTMKFVVEGNATLSGNLDFRYVDVPEGSTLTLAEDLIAPNLNVANWGGVVNYEGANIFMIGNYAETLDDEEATSTLNMNASSDAVSVFNYSIMNVKGGDVNTIVSVGGFVRNYEDAVINNGGIMATVYENSGTINMTAANAQVTVSTGEGTIVNTVLGKVSANSEQDVVATLSTIPGANVLTENHGINHIIFAANSVTINDEAWKRINAKKLKTVEFNGNLVTSKNLTATDVTFKFNNSASWGGDTNTIPTVTVGAVEVAEGKTVKVNYLNVAAKAFNAEQLIANNNGTVTLVQ